MRGPYLADLKQLMTKKIFKEELIGLRANNSAKIKFSSLSLSCFWASQLQTYSSPTVAMMTLKEVLHFTTTYQWEDRLLSLVKTKSKQSGCETRQSPSFLQNQA